MTSFPEVLERLWWRLDRALDMDAVRVSAELALLDCVRWGTTTVFDHHASPNAATWVHHLTSFSPLPIVGTAALT